MLKFDETNLPQLMLLEYRKTALVRATQVSEEFEVTTAQGNVARGAPGDYLCVGPHGDLWPCRKDIFEDTYALANVLHG